MMVGGDVAALEKAPRSESMARVSFIWAPLAQVKPPKPSTKSCAAAH